MTAGIRFGLSVLGEMMFPPAAAKPAPTAIKVFVAGMGRTGTGSLSLALKELGYRPCWGPDLFEFADEIRDYSAGTMSGDQLLALMAERGFNATGLDIFGMFFFREAARLPGVKMVLTVRDPDAWAESIATTVGLHFAYFTGAPFKWLPLFQKINPFLQEMVSIMSAGHPDDFPNNRAHLRRGYLDLDAEIRRSVPADNLLVYRVKDGWSPLCRFLEVQDCPSTPFPRANDRMEMIATTYVFWLVTWTWPLLLLAPCGSLAAVFWMLRTPSKTNRKKKEA